MFVLLCVLTQALSHQHVCALTARWAPSRTGDFLHTFTDASEDMQLFWEAFPAEGGAARTTYMFTYCDTDKRRPTFQAGLSFKPNLNLDLKLWPRCRF